MEQPPDVQDVVLKLESTLPICRVCLEISMEYIEFEGPLCEVNGQEITYSDGFREISSPCSDLPENLPTNFCVTCANDLLTAYLFLKRVENANFMLKEVKCFSERTNKFNVKEEEYLFGPGDDDCIQKVDFIPDPLEDELSEFDDREDCQNNLPISETSIKKEDRDDLVPEYQMVDFNECSINDDSQQEDLYSMVDSQASPVFIDTAIEPVIETVEENCNMHDEESVSMSDEPGQIYATKSELSNHSKNSFPTKCKHCDRILSTSEQLDSHLLFHQYSIFVEGNTNEMVHRCTLCEKNCKAEAEFVDHINVHRGTKPYECSICSKAFHTKQNLQLHKWGAHTTRETKKRKGRDFEKCQHCERLIRSSHMEIHMEAHSATKAFTCSVCGKQFATNFGLKAHSLAHKQREFICHICNKVCLTEFTLKKHIQYIHLSDRKKYQCEDCGLVFQYPSYLKDHQRKHNMKNRFQCPHCDRSYCRKPQLDIHMRYHTNDFRYKCDQCDKCYVTKSNLMDHVRSRHIQIMYDCDKCDQKFKSVTGLRKHKYMHTGYPYNCPLCSAGQTSRSGMKTHLFGVHKDAVTEEEFNDMFPIIVPKTGFRRPRVQC